MFPTLLNGFLLGWSVAWPPGPVNAEMIRRGLRSRADGGGFWDAWRVGSGACTGDFLWALGVSAGAGALLNKPQIRLILGMVSLVLLLALAAIFAKAAWGTARTHQAAPVTALETSVPATPPRPRSGYFLGLFFALSSPWSIGFWLAVVGSQSATNIGRSFTSSFVLAGAVMLGAIAWTIVLCAAVHSGARVFSRPSWQIWTQALTAAVMIYFAAKLTFQLFS